VFVGRADLGQNRCRLAVIQVAGFDPLRDEGITFAERLKGQGVVAELHVYKGLPHGFPNVLPGLPQTGEFLKRQNDFIMRCASREGLFSAKQSM
jgi:acetyl esterase/lipase